VSPPLSQIPIGAKPWLAMFWVIGLGVLGCRALSLMSAGREAEGTARAVVKSSEGGTLALADGARLEIPVGSLSADGEVSFRRVEPGITTGGIDEFTIPVGDRYEVDLGRQELTGPVTLEIPFDRTALPPGEEPEHVFLSYFDEDRGKWVFAGGEVDPKRNVVSLEVDHASWWQAVTPNWGALVAAVNKIFSANVVSLLEAGALILEECPQEGQYASVDASGANGLIQGCVERDDALAPEFRIVNPRAVYIEVQPMTGWAFFEPTLLAPGESLRFQGDPGKPSPFVASADVTRKAGWRLVIHMTIAMLPGFNELGFQGETIACMTERLKDVSYLASAAEAIADGSLAGAVEQIAWMGADEDAVRRLRTGAVDCDYGPASIWSLPGVKSVLASLATIQSSLELISTYFGSIHGQVSFQWGTSSEAGGEIEPLDRTSEQSIVDWLRDGLENRVLLPFEDLAPPDGLDYTDYYEGGQPKSRAEFIDDIGSRLPHGAVCVGYAVEQDRLSIWTSGWSPPFAITRFCYGDCWDVSPPRESTSAGFLFSKDDDAWTLDTLWLSEASRFYELIGGSAQSLIGCDHASAPSAETAP